MAKDPAFLFYPADFIMGTLFLTNEEVGIYIKLLCAQHQHGGLIEKNVFNTMVGDRKLLREKFVESEEGFFNQRLMEEMELRKIKSKNLSANAIKGWEIRKQCKSNAKASNLHMPIEDVNEDINKDILKGGIIKGGGNIPDQIRFMESFSNTYEQVIGQPFKADKHHYIIIAKLINKYGYDAVCDKAKLLAIHCSRGEVWFAKDGWACFTPETLSRQWNRIIPIMTEEQKKDAKFKAAYEKEQADRRRTDELVKDSLTA